MQTRERFQIAIDGPAGAGKSTVARQVAQKLGICYLDTGAMYRAVAWKAQEKGIDPYDAERLTELARALTITFDPQSGRILCDGTDVTEAIRSPEVTAVVSPVSAVQGVRERLTELQRQEAQAQSIVLDGRDIGTCVLPQANLKIFLTAGIEERVRRRQREMEAKGQKVDAVTLKAEIMARDQQDSKRALSPLKKADDAYLLDTTTLTLSEVVDQVVILAKEVGFDGL